MLLNFKNISFAFLVVVFFYFTYQVFSFPFDRYSYYQKQWEESWNTKLKLLDPVKHINFLEYSNLKNNEILAIERFLQEELKDFIPMTRSRGLIARLLDIYCFNVSNSSCGLYLNKYLKKTSNYRLAGRYPNALNEDSLQKSIKGAIVPDRFYLALTEKGNGSLELIDLAKDWKMYLVFIINKYNPNVEYNMNIDGNIVFNSDGVLSIPPTIDLKIELIKLAEILQCTFDCYLTKNDNGVIIAERVSKTTYMFKKSKSIELNIKKGSILRITPWLGPYNEPFSKVYSRL